LCLDVIYLMTENDESRRDKNKLLEVKMLKRVLSVLLCALLFTAVLPIMSENNIVFAFEKEFGDRIMYGGSAVDVGDDVIFNENGSLYRKTADGEVVLVAEVDGKYLNYYENKLWFTVENKIMSVIPDGSRLKTVCEFDGEVKCLYVHDFGMMYLRGETVYTLTDKEEAVLTREGIVGFVPETNGNIRWIKKNPDYTYIENNGDEIWTDGNDEYLQYVASPNSDTDTESSEEVFETAAISDDSEYSGVYVQIGETTLPLENHMPGTYFSKNGKACTCHNTAATYCIESVGNCNCMRYYPTGVKSTCEVDLLGAQCFAFARMVFWKCFGFIDHSLNSSLYYSVGSLASGAVTENSVKALLMKAAPGAHVRLSAGHSVSILTMDEDFIVIYHGNAGGDGVKSSPCVVSTRRYTWEQFATAAARGIQYVNMPYNYPNSEIILTKKEAGYYKLNSNLNLRAEANTVSESLAVMQKGEIIEVTEVDGFWGKTEYNGKVGWLFLEHTTFFSRKTIIPSGGFILGTDGYLRAAEWKLTFDSFSEYFNKQSLSVKSANGKDLSVSGYVGTGSMVTLEINGDVIDKATVCLAGDVNCNGSLDVGDYILIKRACLNNYKLSDIQAAAADVDGKNGVDVHDYLLVKRYFFESNVEIFSEFTK